VRLWPDGAPRLVGVEGRAGDPKIPAPLATAQPVGVKPSIPDVLIDSAGIHSDVLSHLGHLEVAASE